MKIKILIPIYNDWQSVFKLLENIDQQILETKHDFSVLLINDASKEARPDNLQNFLNSQVSKDRDVQLFTTIRTPIYDNTNISRKHLGNLRFTYPSGAYPKEKQARTEFKEAYQKRFGDYPSKEAYRAYDVTLDVILRFAYQNTLYNPTLGETDYLENRFLYEQDDPKGFQNIAYYLLQHEDYQINEIKK